MRKEPLAFSIQKRLPLLICILLLCVVVALGIASYTGVKKTSLSVASDRLHVVTEQLSTLLSQSMRVTMTTTRIVAGDSSVKTYLRSGGGINDSLTQVSLKKLQTDSQSLYIELLDRDQKKLLHSGKKGIQVRVSTHALLNELKTEPDSTKTSKLYRIGDSIYYAIVSHITDNKQTIGYLLRWRLLYATAQGMEQFSKLLGSNAAIYIGNNDGGVWSDLNKPAGAPPVNIKDTARYFTYTRTNIGPVIALARPIAQTEWTLLLEFSQQKIQEGATRFTGWILAIGGIITLIGMLFAWIMSRNITTPLKKLTAATAAVAAGDYSHDSLAAKVNRNDEIGVLARSFDSMAMQIKNSQDILEKKVEERTSELESFSYSVSHDLRAPLRAISGYAEILKEDYADKLDQEANRLINTIVGKAKTMGELIDDLIMFSRMGRKEISLEPIHMEALAKDCLSELLQQEPEHKYQAKVHPLPDCKGDQSLMKQVWLNLIGNAIKYSSTKERPCIEIGYQEDHSMYIYYVKDNGVGFDMQYAHKLFGVFERLHAQESFPGTGIGLALVKRIIDKHKGKVWAEATAGQGATFYFSLPRQ